MRCPNADPETLKKLYWSDNLSLKDIGEIYDVSGATIHNWFKYFNISRRLIKESHIKVPMLPKIGEKILRKLYWNDGLILKDISIIYKYDESTILKYFQYYGIPCRSRSESTLKRDMEDPTVNIKSRKSQQMRWDSMSENDILIHAEKTSAGRQGIPYEKWENFVSDEWRDTIEYTEWTSAVIKRDNNTCRLCNTKVGIKHRHHIYPVRKYPELKYDVENGITLCPDCHYKTFGCEEEWADTFIMLIN